MATFLAPPHIFDPQDQPAHDYYQPYQESYACHPAGQGAHYYAHTDDQHPAAFLVGAHGGLQLSAASAGHDQPAASHPLYADASPAVTPPYPHDHEAHHQAHRWLPPNHAPLQTRFHRDAVQQHQQQPRAFTQYDPGEMSPVSDDSAGTYYDSPQPYGHAPLVDDRQYVAGYDAANNSGYPAAFYDQTASAASAYPQDAYAGTHEYGQISPVSFEDGEGAPHYGHAEGFCGDYSTDYAAVDAADYRRRYVSDLQPPLRPESPMAHLPYQAPDAYGAGYAVGFDQPDNAHLERPQPLYASSYRAQQRQHAHQHHQQQAFPTPISIPAPRSPPLVEDAPKKPLTLACFFCRKRKIACGSPPPGKKDRTCNQCERRNLQCVYPVNSRRGTRQRELEAFAYPA